MVKNKSAQNWFESGRPDRARLPDSGAVNGSENGLHMRKLWQKEELPNDFEIFKLFKKKIKNIKTLWNGFILNQKLGGRVGRHLSTFKTLERAYIWFYFD